ncbi:MAG: hypothetical protein ACYSWU_28975 [Planctomycetota bacterium]
MKKKPRLAWILVVSGMIYILAAPGFGFYILYQNPPRDYWCPPLGNLTTRASAQLFLGAILCALGVWVAVRHRKRRDNVHQGNGTD